MTIDPGIAIEETILIKNIFRAQRLMFSATMREIRGHFVIKRAQLPLLDRDDVVAYNTLRKWNNGKTARLLPGKTVIEYRGWATKPFTRKYQPANVRYDPVDATEYVMLMQLFCNKEPTLHVPSGVSAQLLSGGSLGNSFFIPTTNTFMTMQLKNVSDVQVQVRATVFGYEL